MTSKPGGTFGDATLWALAAFSSCIGQVLSMQRLICPVICLCAGLLWGAGPACAAHLPNFNPVIPSEHQTETRYQTEAAPPYAMNYTDEVARSLGVRGGRMDLFDTGPADNPLVPALKGGVDGDGAMIRLQWHPGE
jgi:hypothetical protein